MLNDLIADGDMRPDYTFDFSVTQAFKIQLQSLGDIVVVYLLPIL
jgi:hypothetical protein